MENAALAVTEAIAVRYPGAEVVGLLCGPGNNGADGLAIARQLDARGYRVAVVLAAFERGLSPDCATQRRILERLGIPVEELAAPFDAAALAPLAACDLVVDALFGSGLTRPLEGDWARLIEATGRIDRPLLAVDLPSGLDGDRANPIGPALAAEVTVTFAAPKPALVLPPACDLAGELVVGDLGFRVEESGGPGALHLLVGEELARALPVRAAEAHKGSFGHLLLVAGSRGKAGLAEALAGGCPEAMSLPLPETLDGTLALAGWEELAAAAEARSVVAMGPGLGRNDETDELVRRLAQRTARPLVLDADALNAFSGRLDELSRRSAPTVLTPHPGELGRLLGRSASEIQADRLGAVREAARRSGALVVLKGRATLVAAPDGEVWINGTGNAGMASGGSGDVLTGLIGARCAQGDDAAFAAALSVHLHGSAGDLALEQRGGIAVPATELLAFYGEALRDLGR
jgi:NAD(P)H-hydrate epimerase